MNPEVSRRAREVGCTVASWLPAALAGAWAIWGAVQVGSGWYIERQADQAVRFAAISSAEHDNRVKIASDRINDGMGRFLIGSAGVVVGIGIWAVVPQRRPEEAITALPSFDAVPSGGN